MNGRGWQRMALVVAVCALVGAIAGIAGSAAAPSNSSSKASAAAKAKAKKQALKRRAFGLRHRGFGMGGPGGPMRGPVHDEAVVPKPDGSGFLTVTMDSGDLLSVDGNTLHIKQAVGSNVYKDDAAITVSDTVKVIRNFKDATLADLKAGDHVRIITGGPKGDIVFAVDPSFKPPMPPGGPDGDHHEMGPGGPPPGGAPGSYPNDSGSSGSGSNNNS